MTANDKGGTAQRGEERDWRQARAGRSPPRRADRSLRPRTGPADIKN